MIAGKARDHKMVVLCRICKQQFLINVSYEDYREWSHGALIQDAMPYLTDGERELLISGTCGPCFDKMFKE